MSMRSTSLRTPGVHFDLVPHGDQDPDAVRRMDIAGFIGIAEKGPVMEPVKIESWAEFLGTFGRKLATAHLAYAVDGFFQNGGRVCWIVRLADPAIAKAATLKLFRGSAHVLTLEALTPGAWGNDISVKMTAKGAGRFDLVILHRGVQAEAWRDLDYRQWLDQFHREEGVPISRHSRLVHLLPGPEFPIADPVGISDEQDERPLQLNIRQVDERRPFIDPRHGHHLRGGDDGLMPAVDIDAWSPPLTAGVPYSNAADVLLRKSIKEAQSDGNVWRRPIPWARLLRAARSRASTSSGSLTATESYEGMSDPPVLRVHVKEAVSARPKELTVRIAQPSEQAPSVRTDAFDLTVLIPGEKGLPDTVLERHGDLVMNPDDDRYVETVIGERSSLIDVQDLRVHENWMQNRPAAADYRLPAPLGAEQIEQAVKSMIQVPEIGMMAIPDLMPVPPRTGTRTKASALSRPSPHTPPPTRTSHSRGLFGDDEIEKAQEKLVTWCEKAGDRIAILDSPNRPMTAEARRALFRRARVLRSRHATLYTPWIDVRDDQIGSRLCAIPPSGHVAGAFAHNDRYHGVHKAPANEGLEGVIDVTASIDPLTHGDLNTRGISVITASGPRGIRIAGARTLEPDLPWRYLSVTRLYLFIRRGIELNTHWTVFEPNDRSLWYALERSVMKVLMQCWADDMLDGRTPRDGFHVRCDETTNTPDQIALGRVVCEIGVRLVAPIEFLVFRIGRGEHGVELVE